jgi:hypothetical protein
MPRPESAPSPAHNPDVKLTVEAPTLTGRWLLRVTNNDTVPVRLVADARLLVLEITPRSARTGTRCELPADMRPADDMERPLVLPPGRSYAEAFEPRLYCFGERLAGALAQGASVVARLGWTAGRTAHGPFVVSSIEGVEPVVAPMKFLESAPIVLPDDPSPRLSTASAPDPNDPDPPKLTLRATRAIDATSWNGIGLDLTLQNQGNRAVVVRFRPESMRFFVVSARGSEECSWPMRPVAAMRELYATVPPHGSQQLAVLLDAYCTQSFDAPGLLIVRASLDTRRSTAEDIGLRAFQGEVAASGPTLVRLHRGKRAPPVGRPKIEPVAPPGP